MHLLCCNVAALAVAGLFYCWRGYHFQALQEQILRQRVAYLLWMTAFRAD